MFSLIEGRWQARFGSDRLRQLRDALWAVIRQFEVELPECLPILGYGLFSREHKGDLQKSTVPKTGREADFTLFTLLAQPLLLLTFEFEQESPLSLAMSADVVRVLDESGVLIRDLPSLSGVSKESIAIATAFLQKHDFAIIESAAGRGKQIRLTPTGAAAQRAYYQRLSRIEADWQARFGKDAMDALRAILEDFVGDPTQPSPLLPGLEPYPDNWRAKVPPLDVLPHYPMVLHRGGFPDGS